MPLRDIDRNLIDRCLKKEPGAWNDFVDRYMGLIYHVIHHASHSRSRILSSEDVEDIAAEVLLKVVDNDYSTLKKFKGISSLPTYLTVIARVCVKELIKRQREEELGHTNAHRAFVDEGMPTRSKPSSPPRRSNGCSRNSRNAMPRSSDSTI